MDAIKEGMLASAKAAEAAARIGERLFCQNTPNVMNFNSQICTSREQSERLLALGLKKESADMQYHIPHPMPYPIGHKCVGFPAWSLHRLLSLIEYDDGFVDISIKEGRYGIHYGYDDEWYDNLYDAVISCIEALIKEGFLNKEYLEEEK